MEPIPRVLVSDDAAQVIHKLEAEHGPLMFHQSGGCCDGSSPMCYVQGEFRLGGSDLWIGEIVSCPFYISRDQFALWEHTQLLVDVVPGRGASFSLEIPLGVRFLLRSRVFTEEEMANLVPHRTCE